MHNIICGFNRFRNALARIEMEILLWQRNEVRKDWKA